MGAKKLQDSGATVWRLAASQHGVVTRAQLLDLGLSSKAITHRLASGRLHRVWRGVYSVGAPRLTRRGIWISAVLTCGPEALLSHRTAAVLLGIREKHGKEVHVSVPVSVMCRRPGIVVHRRAGSMADHATRRDGIPVTDPVLTLVDLAAGLARDQLEAAINEADKRDLIDPETLRRTLDQLADVPGVAALRQTLDRRTFTLTDTKLERRFLRLARKAGLPLPVTQRYVNTFRVDFYWPQLGLVVETDGLRYHRTPAEQARDRVRDQRHAAAGLTPLRFTHAQVVFEPAHVQATLKAVATRLRDSPQRAVP